MLHFGKSFPWIKLLVSTAYKIGKVVYDTALKSLISIRNNKGPNIDPYGTPQVIFL